jgi:hypothetical protein
MNDELKTAIQMIQERPLTMQQYVERHRAFMESIEPFNRMKYDILSRHIQPIVMYPDGSFEVLPYPDEVQEQLAQVDVIIAHIASMTIVPPANNTHKD